MKRVIRALNQSRLRYAITGAMASSYYGRPRTTLDIDILISAGKGNIAHLAKSLAAAALIVDTEHLEEAWKSEYRIVSIPDGPSPHQLDVIFADGKLERKPGIILGLRTYYQTVESLVLAKLRMIKVTVQSERAAIDREDIKAILESAQVNVRSLRRRAKAQGTLELLNDLTGD